MACFIVVSVHAYLLFSNLIKLSFRSRHLDACYMNLFWFFVNLGGKKSCLFVI